MAIRYIEKFESVSGGLSYTFPLGKYEWESKADLTVPTMRLTGADYAHDFLAYGIAPRQPGMETVRGLIAAATSALAEAERDNMASKLLLAGRGKLYVLNDDATRRWAWARLMVMPDLRVDQRRSLSGILPFIATFMRLSDWFSTSITTVTETVTATAETWTVNNPGNLPAKLVTVRLRSNSATGFTDPLITNERNGYIFGSSRDAASVDSELRLRTEEGTVDFSSTDGASYSDDFNNYTIPSGHAILAFQLEPGDNTIRYTGVTPNVDVEISFYAPWA